MGRFFAQLRRRILRERGLIIGDRVGVLLGLVKMFPLTKLALGGQRAVRVFGGQAMKRRE